MPMGVRGWGRLRRDCLAKMEDGGGLWGRVLPWLVLLGLCAAVLWLLPLPAAALDGSATAGFNQDALVSLDMADRHAAAGRHFQAAKEYRRAIDLGLDGVDVRFRLSLALYGLGLVDEAIVEINQAQQFATGASFLHLPTGILCLAKGDLTLAVQQFIAALRINPGSADAYYYLGEVYYRQGDYPRAWLCCRMAQLLGHPGDGLQRKLSRVAEPTQALPWRTTGEVVHLRSIPVASPEEGQDVLGRIAAGELFEAIATEHGTEANQGAGGYAGSLLPADLDPVIVETLLGLEPFHPPVLLETAGGYQILQRIAPFDPAYWEQLLAPSKPVALGKAQTLKPVKPAVVTKPLADSSPVVVPRPAEPVAAVLPPASIVAEATYFLVFTGSYKSEKTAQAKLEVLKGHGFPAYIDRQEGETGLQHHVIAGKYTLRQEALIAGADLKALKIDYFISESRQRADRQPPSPQPPNTPTAVTAGVPHAPTPADTPGQFRLFAGAFHTEAAARKQVEMLQKRGFPSYQFQQGTASGRSYHVVAGKYSSRQDADEASMQLKALGVAHYIRGGK